MSECDNLEDPINQESGPRKLKEITPNNDFPMLSLFSVSESALVVADENSNIVFWNKGAELMFGWTAAEMKGAMLTKIMPEKYRQAHLEGVKRIREGDKSILLKSKVIGRSTKLEGLRKDGTEFPLELQVVVYVQNEKICFMATLTDLSQAVKIAVAKGIEKELTDALDTVHNNLADLDKKISGHPEISS